MVGTGTLGSPENESAAEAGLGVRLDVTSVATRRTGRKAIDLDSVLSTWMFSEEGPVSAGAPGICRGLTKMYAFGKVARRSNK